MKGTWIAFSILLSVSEFSGSVKAEDNKIGIERQLEQARENAGQPGIEISKDQLDYGRVIGVTGKNESNYPSSIPGKQFPESQETVSSS